jgi:hypothetical protein
MPAVDLNLNLGALESTDPRNIPLGAVQAPAPFPATSRLDVSAVPVYYQNGQPACGGHAGAWFKSYLDVLNLQLAIARSPRFIYDICKRDDGVPNDDGTTLNAIFKSLRDQGAPQLALYPNDIHLAKPVYRDASLIPSAVFQDASQNKTGPWAFLSDLSFDGVRRAAWQNQAVILLIYCDDGFFGTNTPTFTTKKYGHFVVAIPNYDDNAITIIDSTEPTSAFARKSIPRSAFDQGFVRQAATAVDVPNWKLRGLTSQSAIVRWITLQLATLHTALASKVATPTTP